MAIQVEVIGDSIQITLDKSSHGLFGGPCQQVLNRREILRLSGLLLAASDTVERDEGTGERLRILDSVQTLDDLLRSQYWESITAAG